MPTKEKPNKPEILRVAQNDKGLFANHELEEHFERIR